MGTGGDVGQHSHMHVVRTVAVMIGSEGCTKVAMEAGRPAVRAVAKAMETEEAREQASEAGRQWAGRTARWR